MTRLLHVAFRFLFVLPAISTTTRATRNDVVISKGKGSDSMPSTLKLSKAKIPTIPTTVSEPVRRHDGVPHQQAYHWYLRKCSEDPLVTKSVSAALINLVGDVLAQHLEAFLSGDAMVLNVRRMVTFFVCGLLYVGPFVHYWFEFLLRVGKAVEQRFHFSKWKIVLTQVLTDQTLGVGIFFPSYFFVFELLESLVFQRPPSLHQATTKCLGQIRELLVMQYRIFPFTSAFNLTFIPPELRVLFSNTLSLFWNMYLCTLLAK